MGNARVEPRGNAIVITKQASGQGVAASFEEAGNLVICKEFGDDVAGIMEIAQRIDESGALQAVALDPFGVGAIVDALYEIGIGGQERVVGITQAGSFLAPAKIDSLMAAFNAVAWMSANPASSQPSIFLI